MMRPKTSDIQRTRVLFIKGILSSSVHRLRNMSTDPNIKAISDNINFLDIIYSYLFLPAFFSLFVSSALDFLVAPQPHVLYIFVSPFSC